MNIEDRLRAALMDRSLEVETSPQAIFEINRRVSASRARPGFRLQFRPSYVLAGAACAVLAAVAVMSVMQEDSQPDEIGVFDNTQPDTTEAPTDTSDDTAAPAGTDGRVETAPGTAPPSTDASPGTSDPSTATAVGLPSPERARVVWPTPATPAAEWPATANDAASGFVTNYLGLPGNVVGPAATNGATATAVISSPASGSPASTLELAAFDVGDGSERWAVVAARSAMISLDNVDVGTMVSNPAIVSGTGEGLAGSVTGRLYAPTQSPLTGVVMGEAAAVAGTVGSPSAFELSIAYPADASSSAVLVVTNDGSLGGITALPITTAAAVADCAPGGTESGAVTVAVFFPCESSEAGVLIERLHTAPASGSGLLGALRALTAGPTDSEVAAGLYSALPTDSGVVVSVAEADGWAVVDLTAGIESANGPLALGQLNATAFALPSVVAVEYRIDGDCERFAAAVGEGGCRIYSRGGSFPPPGAYEPHALLVAGAGQSAIHVDPSSSSSTVATLSVGDAGGFRLTGVTATAEGSTWLQVVGSDGTLGWVDSRGITVQPAVLDEAQRQLMIDRAGDVVAVASLGDLGRVALSDKGLWVTLISGTPYQTYLPAAGLRAISGWNTDLDLGESGYPMGTTLSDVFRADSIDVISVNNSALGGAGPPASLAGLNYISIVTNQTVVEPPAADEGETEEATEQEPVEPTVAQVVINVYFDFSTGEPQVIALSAHPILPAQ